MATSTHGTVERVRPLVAPILADLALELYDLEHAGGTVKVTVHRPGGVDLEDIALATRLISRELDHADPIAGRYTLEVTSPGLERSLRTPSHFKGALGGAIAVRTHPDVEGERRVRGVLTAADDEGVTVTSETPEGAASRRLSYDDIERAKTVFEWGQAGNAAARPGSSRQRKAAS